MKLSIRNHGAVAVRFAAGAPDGDPDQEGVIDAGDEAVVETADGAGIALREVAEGDESVQSDDDGGDDESEEAETAEDGGEGDENNGGGDPPPPVAEQQKAEAAA